MLTGLFFGLLAAAGWGIVDIAGALTARQIGSLRVQIGTLTVGLAAFLVFTALRPDLLGDNPLPGVLLGLPLGVFAAAGYITYMTALRLGPISVVSPVAVSYGGLSVILAVVLRGESLNAPQAAGALLATVGVAMVALVLEEGSLRSARIVGPGVAAALLTVVLFGLLGVLLAGPIRDHGWLPILLGSRLGNLLAGVVLFLVAMVTGSGRFRTILDPGHAVSRRIVALLVLAGVCDTAAFSAFAIGLEQAPVWIVTLASSLGPVLVVLFAIVQLGERLRPIQWMGLAALAGGLGVLALAG
ncbi:MAG: DMT family transporter [Chloroflexota bacterium]